MKEERIILIGAALAMVAWLAYSRKAQARPSAPVARSGNGYTHIPPYDFTEKYNGIGYDGKPAHIVIA